VSNKSKVMEKKRSSLVSVEKDAPMDNKSRTRSFSTKQSILDQSMKIFKLAEEEKGRLRNLLQDDEEEEH